jgi:hypothetical protein
MGKEDILKFLSEASGMSLRDFAAQYGLQHGRLFTDGARDYCCCAVFDAGHMTKLVTMRLPAARIVEFCDMLDDNRMSTTGCLALWPCVVLCAR